MKSRRKIVLYTIAVLAVIYSLSPIYNLLSISLMTPRDLVSNPLFPPNPNLDNYLRLFGIKLTTVAGTGFQEAANVRLGLFNSSIVATLVMVITLLACVPAGYALGRLRMKGRNVLVGLLLGSRTLPPVSVALPYYFLFSDLGLRGTIEGLVIIQLSLTVPIVTWVLMGFFGALPRDVEAQARVDGCSRAQAFRKVLLPLAAPGIAASAVIAFLFSWNDFFYSWLISSGTPAETYNALLSVFLGETTGTAPEPTLFAAAVIVEIVVAIFVAGFLQKYITSLKLIDPGTVTM